jgi:hypothetical protein
MLFAASLLVIGLLLTLTSAGYVTWCVVFRVDLGALGRTRKAARVALVEASTMLRNDVDPSQVATFLDAASEATRLDSDVALVTG